MYFLAPLECGNGYDGYGEPRKNILQRFHNGALLITIAAVEFRYRWKCVMQNNPLVPHVGHLTFGLEDADQDPAFIGLCRSLPFVYMAIRSSLLLAERLRPLPGAAERRAFIRVSSSGYLS
jgi:hypothetical protein